MVNKTKDQLLYEVLKRRTNFLAATVPLGPAFFSSPFTFLTQDFSDLGLPGILTPNDLVEGIDRKSEICEFEGYKEYKEELRHQIFQMSESSTSHSIILVPFKIKEERHAFALNVFAIPDDGIIAFVFDEFDNAVIDIEKLFYSSFKNDLTGLFNLHTFYDHTKKNPRPVYAGLFDINHFKYVNDTYGHSTGDAVLAEIGKRLIAISGPNEIYYHRSGDEFIFLSFVMDRDYQIRLIERIEKEMEAIPLGSDQVQAAFGLVKIDHHQMAPVNGGYDDRGALLFADVAMYEAKLASKRYVILDKDEDINAILSKGPIENTISRLASALKR